MCVCSCFSPLVLLSPLVVLAHSFCVWCLVFFFVVGRIECVGVRERVYVSVCVCVCSAFSCRSVLFCCLNYIGLLLIIAVVYCSLAVVAGWLLLFIHFISTADFFNYYTTVEVSEPTKRTRTHKYTQQQQFIYFDFVCKRHTLRINFMSTYFDSFLVEQYSRRWTVEQFYSVEFISLSSLHSDCFRATHEIFKKKRKHVCYEVRIVVVFSVVFFVHSYATLSYVR